MQDKLDELDYQILRILMQDAKVPYTDIAKKLFVSSGTVHVRMRKLESMGIVTGSQLLVDYSKLGYDIVAFLGIFLEKSSMYNKVIEELRKIKEVVGANYTTGSYSIFAKVVCKDTEHLRDVISHGIQEIQGIQRTETFISLHESIHRPVRIEMNEPAKPRDNA